MYDFQDTDCTHPGMSKTEGATVYCVFDRGQNQLITGDEMNPCSPYQNKTIKSRSKKHTHCTEQTIHFLWVEM